MKGVPLRIEIGPKDIAKGKMVLVRRDNLKKTDLVFENTEDGILTALDEIQQTLFENAKKLLKEKTLEVTDLEVFKSEMEKGAFLYSPWCGQTKCEEIIKESTGADIRVIPFDAKKEDAKCIVCQNASKTYAIFARSY
jgi:prolyl-tRNA synthetase